MPRLTPDKEANLFDDPTLAEIDEQAADQDFPRIDRGCISLGEGTLRRTRPAGNGPDSDDYPVAH